MSRQVRDWLGRAVSPVRQRWRASAGSSGRPAPPPAPTMAERSAEVRAGALFAQAVQRDPLPPERLMAIADRLRSHPQRRRAAPPRLVVRLAAGLSLLIVGGALAATASHYFDLPLPFGRPSHPTSRPPSPARRPHVGHVGHIGPLGQLPNAGENVQPSSGSQAEAIPLLPPIQRSAPVASAGAGHVPAGRSVAPREHQRKPALLSPAPARSETVSEALALPEPPTQPLAPPDDSSPAVPLRPAAPASLAPERRPPASLAEESALVMSALTALRRQDDPGRALAILDRHDSRFPRGDLADEAALARVEALVKMKRSSDALALLEARGPSRRGSSQRKLVLMRAELRAASGRCAAALDDLDALLVGAPPADAVTERALWGRAACRASGGQADAARADLQSYLRLFPSGQFVRDAHAALNGQGRALPPPKP